MEKIFFIYLLTFISWTFVKQTFSFCFFHMLINAISLQFTFKDTNSHYTWFILKRQTLFLKSCSRITLPAPIRSLRKWPGTFLLFLYLLQLRYPGHCYINVLYLIPGWIIHHSGCRKPEYILEFFYRCSSSRTINTIHDH